MSRVIGAFSAGACANAAPQLAKANKDAAKCKFRFICRLLVQVAGNPIAVEQLDPADFIAAEADMGFNADIAG
jgi:hypothetical protein